MGLDLAQFDTIKKSDEGAVMELLHPITKAVLTLSDGQPLTITLAGGDGERCRNANYIAADKRAAIYSTGRKLLCAAESEKESLDFIVAMTISWQNIALESDVDLPCTRENIRRVYTRFPDFKEQAVRFIESRANFMKASPES